MSFKLILLSALSLSTILFFQNCSKVDFVVPEEKAQSVTSAEVEVQPEVFELSSSGVAEAIDDTGTILLSGSISAIPAISLTSDDGEQSHLATGFASIVSSFE